MSKLKLNELLIDNVNSWGNVEYNIPMRSSQNDTRTSTNVALRHIPDIYSAFSGIDKPLPAKVVGRDMVVQKEGYKATSSDYCIKANNNKANERSDNAINCKRVLFMTAVEKKLLGKNIRQPTILSETKDLYRGEVRHEIGAPVRAPDPEYIFDVVASGRNEAPVIPEYGGGYRRLLDPYYTTYRQAYRPYIADDQYGIGAKDHITLYSENNTPKVRGFGPRLKEIWMPITAKRARGVYDPLSFKIEYKEVSARTTPKWLKGAFKTETATKYTLPYATSPLVTAAHGEQFNLPPFQPNPYQTNAAPYMYCSDYCHISQGTPVNTVVDQLKKKRVQEKCVERLIVSET